MHSASVLGTAPCKDDDVTAQYDVAPIIFTTAVLTSRPALAMNKQYIINNNINTSIEYQHNVTESDTSNSPRVISHHLQ